MKIDKAIEILTQTELQGPPLVPQDFLDAYKLGIEALKRVKDCRDVTCDFAPQLLPRETK